MSHGGSSKAATWREQKGPVRHGYGHGRETSVIIGILRNVFEFCGFAIFSSCRLRRSIWDPLGPALGDLGLRFGPPDHFPDGVSASGRQRAVHAAGATQHEGGPRVGAVSCAARSYFSPTKMRPDPKSRGHFSALMWGSVERVGVNPRGAPACTAEQRSCCLGKPRV